MIGRCKYQYYHNWVAFLVSCFLILSITKCSESDDGNLVAEDEKVGIIDAVKSLFSLGQRWMPYSPTPTLDFRAEDDGGGGGGGGASEKVKDAVVKSMDKSRTAVEDSAKSAAQFTDQAVDKTVKKLKKTLSASATHHQQEL